jgi:hypothetical protein
VPNIVMCCHLTGAFSSDFQLGVFAAAQTSRGQMKRARVISERLVRLGHGQCD